MEDISKTTVGILLVLVIIVSIIGTWVVLDKTGEIQYEAPTESAAVGVVQLTIIDKDSEPASASSATGYVSLNIL